MIPRTFQLGGLACGLLILVAPAICGAEQPDQQPDSFRVVAASAAEAEPVAIRIPATDRVDNSRLMASGYAGRPTGAVRRRPNSFPTSCADWKPPKPSYRH